MNFVKTDVSGSGCRLTLGIVVRSVAGVTARIARDGVEARRALQVRNTALVRLGRLCLRLGAVSVPVSIAIAIPICFVQLAPDTHVQWRLVQADGAGRPPRVMLGLQKRRGGVIMPREVHKRGHGVEGRVSLVIRAGVSLALSSSLGGKVEPARWERAVKNLGDEAEEWRQDTQECRFGDESPDEDGHNAHDYPHD